MAITQENRTQHEADTTVIEWEVKSYLGEGFRLTSIVYMDSTGEQLGWRLHDDANQVRFLLYSHYDWHQARALLAELRAHRSGELR